MPMKRILLVSLIVSGCIGTDYVDDPLVGEKIVVAEEQIALMPSEMATVMAAYYDQYGVERMVPLVWSTTNMSIAEVDNMGLITALSVGQCVIRPSYGDFEGPEISVNVVDDPEAVATVTISSATTQLMIGEKVQLQAVVKNIHGEVLSDKTVLWGSGNGSVISVSATGEAEGIGSGLTSVNAYADGVKSNTLFFTVGGMMRSGTFVSVGSYQAKGTAVLETAGSQLVLTFSSDFETSFALGTYVYLANSTNGSTVRAEGLEVQEIFTNGAKTFNISGVGLSDYKYVIILCKPASVTFGYAELNP